MTEAELLAHRALLALHHAAPVEAAQAVLLELQRLVAVSALAAQQVTATHVHGGAVAGAAARAQRARLAVGLAEVGRLGRVDEVLAVGGLDVVAHGDQRLAVVATHHLGGAFEALQQPVAHLTERCHLLPARAQRARARQPVALTLHAHVELHCLGEEMGVEISVFVCAIV